MRLVRLVPSVLLVAVLAAAPAWAEELPSWSGEDVVLGEGALPEGWKLAEGEKKAAAEKAVEDVVKPIVVGAGLDERDVTSTTAVLENAAGETVTVLFLDVDDPDPKGVPAAVQAAAKEKGWHHQELGTPLRLLIATGPEAARAAVLQRQAATGAERLLAVADKRKNASIKSARDVLASALVLAPKSGGAHAMLGWLTVVEAAQARQRGREEDEKKLYAASLEPFRKAFGPDATAPQPPPAFAHRALASFGLALLMQKTPEANAEAKRVLTKAVEIEGSAGDDGTKWEVRYNLACAHSLLGEKAEGVKHITVALDGMKASLDAEQMREQLDHIAKDTDLDAIRNEPGFKEAVERARAGAASDSGGI
jgi:hypothetical protein